MDWPSIAAELLIKESDAALVLLDTAGKIIATSPAFERILGFSRDEIEGKEWTSLAAPLGGVPSGSRWLSQVQAGTRRHQKAKCQSKDGRELFLSVDVRRVGQRQPGLLLTIRVTKQSSTLDEDITGTDCDYFIRISAIEFGTLQKIAALGRPIRQIAHENRKCYQFFRKGDTPCRDCPALRPIHEPWPRIKVERINGVAVVITAHPIDATTLQFSVRHIDKGVFKAVQDKRIGLLAEKAQLSDRERDVFNCLLMGRSQQDIAAALQLTRRTVKFHVRNVLEKIGADSRADLVRLITY